MSGAAPVSAPPAAPPVRKGRRRVLWAALFASLAVNLFFVGWVASATWFGHRPGGPGGAPFQIRHARMALPDDQRPAVDAIWREGMAGMRERLESLRAARAEFRRLMTADTLDPKAAEAAVADLRAKGDAVFEHVHGTLLRIASALPPALRRTYFEAGLSRYGRGRDRHRDRR